MKTIAITQARYGSSRLPGKILLPIAGKSILEIHLERLKTAKKIDKLIVATTVENSEKIVEVCEKLNVAYYKGSENDVLDRFYQAAKTEQPDYVVRLTSDCPLLGGELVDEVIDFTIENELDYASNRLTYTYPDGIVVEIFTFAALEKAWNEARLLSEREHVAPYIWKNSTFHGEDKFTSANYCNIEEDYEGVRLAIDEAADFELIKILIEKFGIDKDWQVYADEVLRNDEIRKINGYINRNEGYAKSLEKDIISVEK